MKTMPKKAPLLLLSFLLPAAVMTAVFALCGICPFGSRSLGVMDMPHQYISFLYSLRDILSGEASLFYLPSMCLGGNMAGIAAYYLLSPLNLLVCLFPRAYMYEAVSFLYILRVGLCGLTMGYYSLCRNGCSRRCLFPALAYALMAYMLAYSFNYLWQDCVILLPLIALGILRLTEGKGWVLYTLCLGGTLFMNFYIGYILCIFSVLFFLYEVLSREGLDRKYLLPAAGRFAAASISAGALAAVAILPAFLSLSGGKAEFSLSVLTLTPNFDLVDLFSKLYTGAFVYEEIMPTGLPNIFCGAATTALAVLYFANSAIPQRRRILTGCLFFILGISFWLNAPNLIWHGLNVPNWYNYRYAFLFSFLLAAVADRELKDWKAGFRSWHGALPGVLCAIMSVFVFAGRTHDHITWPAATGAVGIAAMVGIGMLLAARPSAGKRLGTALLTGLLLLHTADLGANAFVSLRDLTVPASDPAAYREYVTAKESAFALLPDDGTYVRTESAVTHDMNRCEPMLFGYDGISHFGSTIPGKNLDTLDRLGFDRYTELWSLYGAGVTTAADTLLGIRYLVDPSTPKNYLPLAESGGYTVFENENALPIAWTADAAIAGAAESPNSFEYLRSLYASAAPEVEAELFTPAAVTEIALENYSTEDGVTMTRQTEGMASLTFTLTPQADGRLYGEFDIPDFPGVMVFAENVFVASYANAQTNGSLYLGTFAAGDTVTVKLQTAADIALNTAVFYTENDHALTAYADALKTGGCDLTRLSASHYTGSFTAGEGDELLVFTIPADSAWTVLLDGEAVTPDEVQDCFMAIPVTPGSHTVELRYVPGGLGAGAVITCLAAAAVSVLAILRRRRL